MRFKNLSQEAMQGFWEKWKYIIREILDEFNDDVFHGKGVVRENAWGEKLYLLLETKNGCLYVFPIPDDEIILRVYQKKLGKETLSLKGMVDKSDQENPTGKIHLVIGLVEERYPQAKVALREFLAKGLRRAYKQYWMSLSYG
jgi:hypothetical protein